MKKVVKKLKQSLSILLAVAMVITCVPQTATLAYAASDTDIIDTELSTEAETSDELDELEVSTDEPALELEDADDVPADTTEQPVIADNDAAGDDMEVEQKEGDTASELDPVENDQDLSGGQAAPFGFGENGIEVTIVPNENVTINKAESKLDAEAKTYSFQAKANKGYKIKEVTVKATGTGDKSADLTDISSELLDDGYTKYTISLSDDALGDGFSSDDLSALEIVITTEAYTVILPADENLNAVVAIKSGATKGEDDILRTTAAEDIVFTVTPSTGYKVAEVSFAAGGSNTPLAGKNSEEGVIEYTISKDDIKGDVVISVVTAEIEMVAVTVAGYEDKATNHYEVYSVTKNANGTYKKAAKAYAKGDEWKVEKGSDVYFVVEAAEMYKVANVGGAKRGDKLDDGTQIYTKNRVDAALEITVTMGLDEDTAYRANFAIAADARYTLTASSIDGAEAAAAVDEVNTKVKGLKYVYTALESIKLTVKPDDGYNVDKIEKVGDDGNKETVSTTAGEDGAVTFTLTFSETEKKVNYEVTVTAKPLNTDGGTITFDIADAEDLTLTVTSDAGKVAPVEDEENKYQVKSGAQYVEFTLTSKNEKIVPVVKVGTEEWSSRTEESPYEYKISASLFAASGSETTIKITQEAVTKKLTVVSDALQIDFNKVTAVVGDNEYNIQNATEWGEFEGINYSDYVEFDIPIDSEVVLHVEAQDEYKIASYQIGKAKAQDVDGKTTDINLTLTDDTIVIINPASDPTPYTVTLRQGDEIVESKDDTYSYSVDYGKTYIATLSKGDMTSAPAKVEIEPEGNSTADIETDTMATAITVSSADAGKKLTVKIWVSEDVEKAEPSATLKLQVSKMITKATITGVSRGGKLTQTVDTVQAYDIKVEPKDADVNNLVADIKWAEDAADTDKNAFTASVVEGKLVITTATAKDADAAAALDTAAQKATIRLVDKTKVENGNYADAASVTNSEFKLTIAAPTGLTGALPTVVLKSSDDVSLTLTLGVPAAAKIAEPNLGKLWYEVTVTPDSSVSDNNISKEAATYYFAKKAANTQDEKIVVSNAEFGSGKGYKFNVTAKVVQTVDKNEPSAENLPAFESKVKTLAAATKNPYFATKLTLKKGTTNVYTGMEDIKIATINFGKDTTYTLDEHISVEDVTTGSVIIAKEAFYVRDGNVYVTLKNDKVSTDSNGFLSVGLGKHTIRVTATSPGDTWAAYADLVITVNRGIEMLDLSETSDRIYKANTSKATLKVTPVYNKGWSGNYAAKTKKVKDYALVAVDQSGNVMQKDGHDVVIEDKNLTVKNGTVTVAKGFDLEAAIANGTNKFKVRATSADWTDKASGTSSSVYGYSGLITITDQPMTLGDVVVVAFDSEQKGYVPIIREGKKSATSGEFAYNAYNDQYGYYNAQVVVLKPETEAKDVYNWDDFVDSSNLTFKSSNAKALGISSYGWITTVKTGKNIKITVSANDGSKTSKVLDKIEIMNQKPKALGLKVEKVNYGGVYSDYNENLNNDYTDKDVRFTGTTNSVLQLTVMREGENGNWYELDELTDLKVTISNAKVLNKVSAFNQKYTVIANSAAATVKLQYTDEEGEKQTEIFTINNDGVKTVKAPNLKASGNLVANYHAGAQTVVYKLNGNYDYEDKVVMVNTDAADRNNSKNTVRYSSLENQGNVNGWTGISEDGTFELNFNNVDWRQDENTWFTNITAGSYKLSFTFGKVDVDGSFIPETKPVNMTLKAVAPKTVKFSYKPVTTVKMSVYDTAAGKVLTGTGKFTYEHYSNLLNANITGQANHFTQLFDLDNNNVLRLKSEFTKDLRDALNVETDEDVIKYITGNSKEAKNDRIGYVSYYAYGDTGYVNSQTKITVTFDTKKSTDTYALTNTTILQGTTNASVKVLKNKKAGAEISDAYVIGSDKDGKFTVAYAGSDVISFTLDGATADTADKYKVTVAVVPANNYYAEDIAAKKTAWERAENAQESDTAAADTAKAAYVEAITANGIQLTTTVTVGAKAKQGNKISVAKNNLKPAFTSGYNKVEGGWESGYDGKNGDYWIHVPYTKNMACELAYIESNDTKLAAARENESQNLVSFGYGKQDWDKDRDDYGQDFIHIGLNKTEFAQAVEAGKVKYTTAKKKATLTVKATVHFGSKWVEDAENSENGHWEAETDADGKDVIMTETISFTITLPSEQGYNYETAVEAVKAAKDSIAEASVPASWIWNGEGLPLPEADDGVIVLTGGELTWKLNDLIGNVREEVEKRVPPDTGVEIRMPQECVYNKDEGKDIMTLQESDFTAPTTTTKGTFIVRAYLYDASTLDDNNNPILEGDNKSTVTPVEFELEIPELKEKPSDVKEAIEQFVEEKTADPDYVKAITGPDDIANDARKAAGLVDKDGKPIGSLRLSVIDYEFNPAVEGNKGSISGCIKVFGYRYGGDEICVGFTFELDTLAETVTNVSAAVNAFEATNNTTKADILEAAIEAIKNPQFTAVWQKAGDDTLKDNGTTVSDDDGDVYNLKEATRDADGSVKGTIVIVDREDDSVTEENLVNVNLTIAQQAGTDDAVKKVKAAVGFDDNGSAVDTEKIKGLVLAYGNSKETVKAGILKAANKAVENDGYTVAYKKDTTDTTDDLFDFKSANYKATGTQGQEGYNAGTGTIKFTLVITDAKAAEGDAAIPDVEMTAQTFGPFAELQTLDQAKADVEEALDAYKETITTSVIGNAVNGDAVKTAADNVVTGTGLSVTVEDFDIVIATVKSKGSITCKVVITKTAEDAEDETETIDFEVEIPKVVQTLDEAKAAVQTALNAMAEDKFTNDDIETVEIPAATEGGEAAKKDVVKEAVLGAVIAEVKKSIDTDSFEVKLSDVSDEYVVEKATINKKGKVKITLTITAKTTTGEDTPAAQANGDPSREWDIAELAQSPEAAEKAAKDAIAAYIAEKYAEGITDTDSASIDTTIAGEIKSAIEEVVKNGVYTVKAKADNDSKVFTKKDADSENPACYEATFVLEYTEGGAEKKIELNVVIKAKEETQNPDDESKTGSENESNAVSSVSANDSGH